MTKDPTHLHDIAYGEVPRQFWAMLSNRRLNELIKGDCLTDEEVALIYRIQGRLN